MVYIISLMNVMNIGFVALFRENCMRYSQKIVSIIRRKLRAFFAQKSVCPLHHWPKKGGNNCVCVCVCCNFEDISGTQRTLSRKLHLAPLSVRNNVPKDVESLI